MKVLIWYIDKWYEHKSTVKYPYLTGVKNCEILFIDTQMVEKKTIPDPHWFKHGEIGL